MEAVQAVLAATANPEAPNEVKVSRPSDALAARQATDKTFTGLLLGLGAVALLVGGVGVANTMVISVLERRAEIGLRRSLGATKGQVRSQFLTESLLLAALGGLGGVLLGGLVTTGYALLQAWPSVVPAWATLGGVGATIVIGGIAGPLPGDARRPASPHRSTSHAIAARRAPSPAQGHRNFREIAALRLCDTANSPKSRGSCAGLARRWKYRYSRSRALRSGSRPSAPRLSASPWNCLQVERRHPCGPWRRRGPAARCARPPCTTGPGPASRGSG